MSEKFRQAWAAWLENYGRPWWKQAIVWPFGVDVFALPPGARTLRWYAVAAFESLVVKPAQLFALCLFWWCWVPQFPLAQWFWNKRWPSHIQNGTDEYWRAVPTASSSLLHYGVINHICWLSVVATVFVAGTVMFSSDASNLGLAALINYFLASIGLVVAGQMFFLNSAPEASDYRVLAVFGNLLVAIAFVLEMIFVGDSRRLLPFSVAAISALGLPSFGIAVLSFGLLDQKWAFVSASTGAMSVASRKRSRWWGGLNLAFTDICLGGSPLPYFDGKMNSVGALTMLLNGNVPDTKQIVGIVLLVFTYVVAVFAFELIWQYTPFGFLRWQRRQAFHARILNALSPHMLRNILDSINTRLRQSARTIQSDATRIQLVAPDTSPLTDKTRQQISELTITINNELLAPELAIADLARFSHWLHQAAKPQGRHWPLAWEIQAAQDYLYTAKNLRVGLDIDFEKVSEFYAEKADRMRLQVPAMLLQPLVENAFVHGIFDSGLNYAKISLSASVVDRALVLIVTTASDGWDKRQNKSATEKRGTGTEITAHLVRRWSSSAKFVQAPLPSGDGYRATITVPMSDVLIDSMSDDDLYEFLP